MSDENSDLKEMDAVERDYAARAGSVFTAARKAHLALGHDVLIARGDAIVRLAPDGSSHFVKHITPPSRVTPGTKFKLL